MTVDRENMQRAIKHFLVPQIRALGFKGSFPYFKRRGHEEHQMLMIFFNKYGGSFYVEAGRISDQRVRERQQHWASAGKILEESSLTVGHCQPDHRGRLGPEGFSRNDHWFVFGPDSTHSGNYPSQPTSVYDKIASQAALWVKEHTAAFFGTAP
jgi:Domain of unknown function (DUF4304)